MSAPISDLDAVLHAAISVGLSIDLNALVEARYGDRTDGEAFLARHHLGRLQSALDVFLGKPTKQPTQE